MNKIQKLFFGYEDVPACVFFLLWRCNGFGNGLNCLDTTTKVFSHEK